MTRHPDHLPRARAALSCAWLCAALPAFATDTKSGGDWLDPTIWTLGIPGPSDGAVIAGHSVTLENFGAAAALQMDGRLDLRGAKAPSTTVGSLTIGQTLIVGNDATGTLNLSDGGRLRSRDTYLGYRTGSEGNLSIDGSPSWRGDRSSWTNTGELFVGSAGFGPARASVQAFNGATVDTYNTTIGSGVSTGAVEIRNATWTNTNLFRVGSGGTFGTLSIASRGVLNSLTGVIGYGSGSTGASTGTLGTASVDNGTWRNSGDFHVGWYARGTLAVRNQGLVENTLGYIGYGATAVGDVVVSNSTWTNRGGLNVGYNGQGTLLVERGAAVTSALGILGAYGNAKGTVTVDDASWANAGELYVGYGLPGMGAPAEGVLTVRNGGIVSATSAIVGLTRDARGSVTVAGVDGTGRAAQWNLSGDLQVGGAGYGTLDVGAGGIVRSRDTYVGYQGTGNVTLAGGTAGRGVLETRQLSSGTGAGPQGGTLTFDGGVLRASADSADFVRNFGVVSVQAGGAFIDSNHHRVGTGAGFTGNGGIVKLGQGVLDLRGVSFLGALSTVQAGTLFVNGSLTGDVQVDSGATLGGAGRVQGLVSVLPGGMLAPGNSPGTLTVGSLLMAAGSGMAIELGAPGDHLIVLGDVSLGGRIDFSGDASAFGSGSFLSYGGTLFDAGVVIGSLPGGLDPRDYALDFGTPGTVGVMQAVPEPASALLMSLGGLLVLLGAGRRLNTTATR